MLKLNKSITFNTQTKQGDTMKTYKVNYEMAGYKLDATVSAACMSDALYEFDIQGITVTNIARKGR